MTVPTDAMLDAMLDEVMVVFQPIEGTYDLEVVAGFVGALGFAFRDEADPSTFVVSSDAESRDIFQARRRADPSGLFPRVLRVVAGPSEILVFPAAYAPGLRALSQQVLEWLAETFPSRITGEFGNDLSGAGTVVPAAAR